MLKRFDLSAMFDELNELHFNGEIPKIPVSWNNRLRTTAGRCFWVRDLSYVGKEPTRIELANRLFANNDWDSDKVKRTLIHEMVHAYLLHKYNESGHTSRFHMTMTRITGEWKNHRCHNYNTDGLKESRNVQTICPVHGVIGHRARMPRKNSAYVHKNCGERVSFKRVAVVKQSLSSGISLD